jgi:hypothetical protein
MTASEKQALKFAKAVQALIPGMSVPVWDGKTCKEKGYGRAAAGVVLEETPFGAVNELVVESTDNYGEFPLSGMTRVRGVHAEPYASWLLLFYKDTE